MRPLRMPFSTLISARPKPIGASLKVKVTVEVSPAIKALSDKVIATVGDFVSTV
jgi:hypothetical protein